MLLELATEDEVMECDDGELCACVCALLVEEGGK